MPRLAEAGEFCIQNDKFCSKTEEVCIKNDEFCTKYDEYVLKMIKFVFKMTEARHREAGQGRNISINFNECLIKIDEYLH